MPLIRPSRRDLLKLMSLAPALAMPAHVQAMLGAPEGGNPAHFRFTLGDLRLSILSDGYFSMPTRGLGVNADPAEVAAFLSAHFLSPEQGYSHTNHLLIESGEAKVLVDVGSGARFFDTAGRLLQNMAQAGVDPAEITHVVITHAHPDHIWGIRDDFDEALFPGATYVIGAAEHDYWTQEGLVDRVAPEDQQFVLGAVNSIQCDGVDWVLAEDNHEVVPGVRMIATPGHTPGHMSVLVESGADQLIALGDAMTHGWLSFQRPNWYNGTDMDGPQTVATRQKLLARCSAERIAVLGYHFPFPGVGHVLPEAETYRFVPALWQF